MLHWWISGGESTCSQFSSSERKGHLSVGLRILRRSRKVSAEIIERFSSVPVANVSDSMARMGAGVPTFGRCMQGVGSQGRR